jgi:RHS repeat-associated protein
MILEGRSAVNGDGRPRFKFTGKERDAESKYDYFGARYFDARVGRFLGVDPHSSSYPDLSSYCYVGNNPLSFMDPTGMDSTKAANVFPVVLTLPALPFLPTVINVPSVIHGLATVGSTVLRVTPLGLAFLPLSDAPISLMQETAEGDNTKSKAEVAKEKQASQEGSNDETSELEKRIAEHQKKLEDYKANPEKFDNKDFLKNAPTKEIRDRIIKGRVKHLENEIRAMSKALEGQRGGTGK